MATGQVKSNTPAASSITTTEIADGTIATADIADAAVTLAKMANVATDKLIGRDTAGTGVPEVLSVGGGVEFSGSGGIQRSALTGDVTASAASNSTTIANNAVTVGKMATLAARSILGNSTAATADVAAITAGSDGDVLRRSGTTVAFGAIPESSVTNLTTDLAAKATATNAADTLVPYWNGTTALTASSNLTFNGTKLIAAGTSQGVVTAGATTGSNSVQIRGGATNTGEFFMAGGTDHFVTGSSSGDIGIACYTNTQKIHLSAGGGTQVIIDGGAGTPTVSLGGLDLIKVKGVSYAWPSANASGQLTNNGSGTLSWTAASVSSVKLDDAAAPDDNTDLNATTSAHGLLLKATAPSSGLVNVVGIANGETAYTNKALFDATTPAALAAAAATGSATVAARRDHVHALPAIDALAAATDITTANASTSAHGLVVKATAPASGLMNFVGLTNGETAYTNKPLFDTTNPAALGTAGPGTQVIAARRDHVHANPAIDTLAAATDITTLNASTSAHGLLPKLDNTSTHYLDGTGAWSTPAGGQPAGFSGSLTVAADKSLPIVSTSNFNEMTTASANLAFLPTTGFSAGRVVYIRNGVNSNQTIEHNTASPPGGYAAILSPTNANYTFYNRHVYAFAFNGTNWYVAPYVA